MSFVIDDDRVRELLRETVEQYVVTSTQVDAPSIEVELPSADVFGTVSMVPVSYSAEHLRETFLSIRRKIVESGSPLLTAEEIDHELDESRGPQL